MLLAIDTSNDYAGVALWSEQGLRAEANWFAGRRHTEQVLPQLDLLLRGLGAEPEALEVVAVATGPGSWSGLRAGMSLVKALAIGRGLPLVGVPTLDALAYGQRGRQGPVVAIIRLGRDRYGCAVYDVAAGGCERTTPFQTVAADAVPALAQASLLVGDIPAGLAADTTGLRLPAAPDHQRRAAFVAEIGWERHGRGAYDDLVALEPIYLGGPVGSNTISG